MTAAAATAHTWSSQQDAIFSWFESANNGPKNLIVRARAGTGKTTTIIEGINRAPEANIILCAFNKRIADELAARIKNPNAQAKTLHAIGFMLVRRFWSGVRIEDTRDRNKVSRADGLAEKVCGPKAPDTIKRLVSNLHTKGREIAPMATKVGDLTALQAQFELEPDEQWAGSQFDARYVEEKALEAMELACSVKPVEIDFADMIFLPVRNGWMHPFADLVVVDEAQDMTVAQLALARGICGGRICVVGDDRQAIYGFRGADSESLDRLKKELTAAELSLNVTYRCGLAIVAAAQRLVPDFQAGPANPAGDIQSLDASKVLTTVENGDFILSRLNAPLVGLAMSLLRNGKRARIAGKDVGAGLKSLVKKLAKGPAATSVPKFMEAVARWETREVDRQLAAGRQNQVDLAHDKAEMLIELAADAKSVRDIEARIEALFTDDGLGQAGVITLSSVHKAKGLEANRVFVLTYTLYPGKRMTREEENIEYVAITRAKNTLVLVVEDKE